MDFLFHKVSEKDKEEIKKQAKEIMDKFSEKLSNVSEKTFDPLIDRKEFEREERIENSQSSTKNVGREVKGKEANSDFRERMFANAPRKNKDFILAEKKKW